MSLDRGQVTFVELFGQTADKTVPAMKVTGLLPSTTCYFVVGLLTYEHENQANTIESDDSKVVSATTAGKK